MYHYADSFFTLLIIGNLILIVFKETQPNYGDNTEEMKNNFEFDCFHPLRQRLGVIWKGLKKWTPCNQLQITETQ